MPRVTLRGVLLPAAVPVAFLAGLLAAHTTPPARAQAPALQPQVIDLAAITDASRSVRRPDAGHAAVASTLVVQPTGTMAVQTGNVPKHTHSDANEFQYVIAGSGTFWLGDQAREIHPGDLIIIPKGTVHAGSVHQRERRVEGAGDQAAAAGAGRPASRALNKGSYSGRSRLAAEQQHAGQAGQVRQPVLQRQRRRAAQAQGHEHLVVPPHRAVRLMAQEPHAHVEQPG